MSNNTDTRSVEVIIKGTQASSTIKEIRAAAAVLNAELSKLPANSKLFKEKAEELRSVNDRLHDIKNDVNSVSESFGNMAKGMLLAGGIEGAFEKIKGFAEDSFKSFVALETQERKLSFALTNVGHEGKLAFEELKTQAEDLEGFFSHKDIIGSQALQAEFGLTAEQIKKLTPEIMDLARVQGVDLATATNTALKAVEGQTRGLKSVGITFKDTGSKTENFNLLTEKLTKFQGAAADALETTEGKMKRFDNAMEKLKETMGEFEANEANDLLDFFDALFTKSTFAEAGVRRALGLLQQGADTYILKTLETAKKSEADRLRLIAETDKQIIMLGEKMQGNTNDMQRKGYALQIKNYQDLLNQLRTLNDKKHIADDATSGNRDAEKLAKKEEFLRKMKDENEKEANDSVDVMKAADAKIKGINDKNEAQDQKDADRHYGQLVQEENEETKLKVKSLEERKKLEEQHAKEIKKIQQGLAEFEKDIITGLDAWNTIQHNKEDERMKLAEQHQTSADEHDRELLKAKLITQAEFDKRSLNNQHKKELEERAIKKKAFERDQKIAIFKTLVDGAEGSAKIWATYADVPYVAALLQVAEAAVITLQLQAIKSAPKPYAKGGFNADPSGFTKGPQVFDSASGSPFLAGEKGREWIAPNWMLEQPQTANIIHQLENIRQNRGYAMGGLTAADPAGLGAANGNTLINTTRSNIKHQNMPIDHHLLKVITRLNEHLDNGIGLNFDKFTKDMKKIDDAKNASRVG